MANVSSPLKIKKSSPQSAVSTDGTAHSFMTARRKTGCGYGRATYLDHHDPRTSSPSTYVHRTLRPTSTQTFYQKYDNHKYNNYVHSSCQT